MPPYPERESSMLAKMKAKEEAVTDKTWKQARKNRGSASDADLRGSDSREILSAGPSSGSTGGGDLLDFGGGGGGGAGAGSALAAGGSQPAEPTPGTERYLPALMAANQGVLFENQALQIGVKIETRNNLGVCVDTSAPLCRSCAWHAVCDEASMRLFLLTKAA